MKWLIIINSTCDNTAAKHNYCLDLNHIIIMIHTTMAANNNNSITNDNGNNSGNSNDNTNGEYFNGV